MDVADRNGVQSFWGCAGFVDDPAVGFSDRGRGYRCDEEAPSRHRWVAVTDENRESGLPENESLRTRIAAVIHNIQKPWGSPEFTELNTTAQQLYLEQADAVIRNIPELQAHCGCQTKNWAAISEREHPRWESDAIDLSDETVFDSTAAVLDTSTRRHLGEEEWKRCARKWSWLAYQRATDLLFPPREKGDGQNRDV